MSDKAKELPEMATSEAQEIAKVTRIITLSYSAVRYAGDTLIAKLKEQGLDLPEDPVVVDTKKYYGLPEDVDPGVELSHVWHGFKSFWVPGSYQFDQKREQPCFRRLAILVPELVGFVDSRMPALTEHNKHYTPDRLSISLPLIASLDLMSNHLIGPDDSDVFVSDGNIKHNYLV